MTWIENNPTYQGDEELARRFFELVLFKMSDDKQQTYYQKWQTFNSSWLKLCNILHVLLDEEERQSEPEENAISTFNRISAILCQNMRRFRAEAQRQAKQFIKEMTPVIYIDELNNDNHAFDYLK